MEYLVAQAVAMMTLTGAAFLYLLVISLSPHVARCRRSDKAGAAALDAAAEQRATPDLVRFTRRMGLLCCALALCVAFDYERARFVMPLYVYLPLLVSLQSAYLALVAAWSHANVRAVYVQLRQAPPQWLYASLMGTSAVYWCTCIVLQSVFLSDQTRFRLCYVLSYVLAVIAALLIAGYAGFHALRLRTVVLRHIQRVEALVPPLPPAKPNASANSKTDANGNRIAPNGHASSASITAAPPLLVVVSPPSPGGTTALARPTPPFATAAVPLTPGGGGGGTKAGVSGVSGVSGHSGVGSGFDTRDLRSAVSRLLLQAVFLCVIVVFLVVGVALIAIPWVQDLTKVDDAIASPAARTFGSTTLGGWALLLVSLFPAWLATPLSWRVAYARVWTRMGCCGSCACCSPPNADADADANTDTVHARADGPAPHATPRGRVSSPQLRGVTVSTATPAVAVVAPLRPTANAWSAPAPAAPTTAAGSAAAPALSPSHTVGVANSS